MPNFSLRQLNKFRSNFPAQLRRHRSSTSLAISSIKSSNVNDSAIPNSNTIIVSTTTKEEEESKVNSNKNKKPKPFFPKRGETLELVCESLGFKGKGLCKVEETGYVVMCDRALPGERFIGRVTRKKNNYSENCR